MFFNKIMPRKVGIFLSHYSNVIHAIFRNNKNLFSLEYDKSIPCNNIGSWMKNFKKANISSPKIGYIVSEFSKCKIEILKRIDIANNDAVVICVEKNEIIKINNFLGHYRKLGFDKFVILDNDSNDGTREFLLNQDDVFLLSTKSTYSSMNRVAWINRIISFIGTNRWYCVADADEFLEYCDDEIYNIYDLISFLEFHNIYRLRALLVDMYPLYDFYIEGNDSEFYNKFMYFDSNSYYDYKDFRFKSVIGGPRNRMFKTPTCVVKYPLFYFKSNDIYISSHFMFPYYGNFKCEYDAVLKHYKFLKSDIAKIDGIIKNANYYNGSYDYKIYRKYIHDSKGVNFHNNESCLYTNSHSFDVIPVYNKIEWY